MYVPFVFLLVLFYYFYFALFLLAHYCLCAFGVALSFCDMSSYSVTILPKCSCWVSKVKQSVSLLS